MQLLILIKHYSIVLMFCIIVLLYYIVLYCIVLYCIVLYDWYTDVCNSTNRRVQISYVIVHFENRLNQFLKMTAANVVFMKNGSNYFVSKYWRWRGRSISKYQVISLFQHRNLARAGKQQFHWRKRFTIIFIEEMQTGNDNSLKNEIWPESRAAFDRGKWLQFMKDHKCSNISWHKFTAPKRADLKRLKH